jgi:hypothetical protein
LDKRRWRSNCLKPPVTAGSPKGVLGSRDDRRLQPEHPHVADQASEHVLGAPSIREFLERHPHEATIAVRSRGFERHGHRRAGLTYEP